MMAKNPELRGERLPRPRIVPLLGERGEGGRKLIMWRRKRKRRKLERKL